MTFDLTTLCPHCGAAHECATPVGCPDIRPREGAVALCHTCGKFSIFDTDGALRKPTADELRHVEKHNKGAARARAAWLALHGARQGPRRQ